MHCDKNYENNNKININNKLGTMFLIDFIFEAIKFKYQLAVYLQTSTTS